MSERGIGRTGSEPGMLLYFAQIIQDPREDYSEQAGNTNRAQWTKNFSCCQLELFFSALNKIRIALMLANIRNWRRQGETTFNYFIQFRVKINFWIGINVNFSFVFGLTFYKYQVKTLLMLVSYVYTTLWQGKLRFRKLKSTRSWLPFTFSLGSTTAMGSLSGPIFAVPTGW